MVNPTDWTQSTDARHVPFAVLLAERELRLVPHPRRSRRAPLGLLRGHTVRIDGQ
jgi:hypothetical protein